MFVRLLQRWGCQSDSKPHNTPYYLLILYILVLFIFLHSISGQRKKYFLCSLEKNISVQSKNLSSVSFIHLRCQSKIEFESINQHEWDVNTQQTHQQNTYTPSLSLPLFSSHSLSLSLTYSIIFLSLPLFPSLSLSQIMFLETKQTILLNIGQTILKICSTSSTPFCSIWEVLIFKKK